MLRRMRSFLERVCLYVGSRGCRDATRLVYRRNCAQASVYNWDEYWEVGSEVVSKLGCLGASPLRLRAETCCGQISLSSRLTHTSLFTYRLPCLLQNCTNILDYPTENGNAYSQAQAILFLDHEIWKYYKMKEIGSIVLNCS